MTQASCRGKKNNNTKLVVQEVQAVRLHLWLPRDDWDEQQLLPPGEEGGRRPAGQLDQDPQRRLVRLPGERCVCVCVCVGVGV